MSNERLAALIQTICSTGIRVSELQAITVESLERGYAQVNSKGKIRHILMPRKLRKLLSDYCRKKGIVHGCVFITEGGRPLDRGNIWKMMKVLAERANVPTHKVFPHNLRHLFARTYYEKYKDIVRLADILGHANIETTRIYTIGTVSEQQKQIESLDFLED